MSTKSDINKHDWFINIFPKNIRPFLYLARIDRSLPMLLLFLPTLWGLLAGAFYSQTPLIDTVCYVLLFLFGSIVMRGAGCTWNDITDVDFDKQVARTKTRPIASGAITKKSAFIFLIIQLLLGASVLLFLPMWSIILAFCAMIPVIIYPFMKRFTYYPQAWLGITFNWGIWVGWFVFANDNLIVPLLLHIAGWFMTMAYDTIYAHQDKDDDILIGVKSTALKFGNKTKPLVSIFYIIVIAIFIKIKYILSMGNVSFIPIFITAIYFVYLVVKLNINDSNNCLKVFKQNSYCEMILVLTFIIY